jgi:hypothetical protein
MRRRFDCTGLLANDPGDSQIGADSGMFLVD